MLILVLFPQIKIVVCVLVSKSSTAVLTVDQQPMFLASKQTTNCQPGYNKPFSNVILTASRPHVQICLQLLISILGIDFPEGTMKSGDVPALNLVWGNDVICRMMSDQLAQS